MDLNEFMKSLMGIGSEYSIVRMEKEEYPEQIVNIYLKYNKRTYTKTGSNTSCVIIHQSGNGSI